MLAERLCSGLQWWSDTSAAQPVPPPPLPSCSVQKRIGLEKEERSLFWGSPDRGYDRDSHRSNPGLSVTVTSSCQPPLLHWVPFFFLPPPFGDTRSFKSELARLACAALKRTSQELGLFFFFWEGKMLALLPRFPFSQTAINHCCQTCASKASERG